MTHKLVLDGGDETLFFFTIQSMNKQFRILTLLRVICKGTDINCPDNICDWNFFAVTFIGKTNLD